MDLSRDLKTISKLEKSIKILKILETTLTVGIIAFTVFRMIATIKE